MEYWKFLVDKDIVSEKYSVSSTGLVRLNSDGRILNNNDNGAGYKVVGLYTKDKKTKIYYVHRLVASHFIENPEGKPQVGHIDHNKENNNVNNLYWCTQKENTNDGIAAGRINSKKRGQTKKLSPEQIKEIARLSIVEGFGVNEIAIHLDFPRTTISSVFNGRSNWALFQRSIEELKMS